MTQPISLHWPHVEATKLLGENSNFNVNKYIQKSSVGENLNFFLKLNSLLNSAKIGLLPPSIDPHLKSSHSIEKQKHENKILLPLQSITYFWNLNFSLPNCSLSLSSQDSSEKKVFSTQKESKQKRFQLKFSILCY